MRLNILYLAAGMALSLMTAAPAGAQTASAGAAPAPTSLVCASKPGERQACVADTSNGVSLTASLGTVACERSRTWDYDAAEIWVSDGCVGVFAITPAARDSYGPQGFRLADAGMGDVNLKLFSYVRHLNQEGLDNSYTDSFGTERAIDARQDVHLQKVNIQFLGWIANRQLRYMAYVWTTNTSQGLGAQVVVGGYLQYAFNKHVSVGGGIGALPGTRTLEGNFPFWLPVDNRLIAEEFFRPSYSQGIWVKGTVVDRLEYQAMLANNLSQLGVDAGQLDSGLDALSTSLVWMPTTGEFGRGFGDFEPHKDVATRLGIHFTRSDENRQSQPNTEAIENSQIRLSDGNVIFTPGLFGPGIAITDARYQMVAADAAVKYAGFSALRRSASPPWRVNSTGGGWRISAAPRWQPFRSPPSVTAASRSRRRPWRSRRPLRSISPALKFSASTATPGTSAADSTTTRSRMRSCAGTWSICISATHRSGRCRCRRWSAPTGRSSTAASWSTSEGSRPHGDVAR